MASYSVFNINTVTVPTVTTVDPATSTHLPALGYKVIGSIFTTVSIFAFFANGCGLLVFLRNKTLRSPTNLFIMSLSICDILMALCSSMACAASFSHGWVFGDVFCVLEGFMVYFLGLTSMYLLAAISVDRYIVMSKPLMSYKITHRVAATAIFVCWGMGFFWAALPLVGWNHYSLEGVGISCSIVWQSEDPVNFSYIIVIFSFCFIFPLCLMAFSYYHVYMTIRNIAKCNVWNSKSRVARKNLKLERKLFRTCLLMVCMYLLSWLPYTIVSFMSAFGAAKIISPLMATVPALVAKCSGLWNPVIYIATNAQFRIALYELLPCSPLKKDLDNNTDARLVSSEDRTYKTRSGFSCEKKTKAGQMFDLTLMKDQIPVDQTVVEELSPRVSPVNGRCVRIELSDLGMGNKADI
ncbi:parapinopsin-like [Haliotis rufescens]|uniref:parapinopsin-like n=1 Tax=Haliotis rufescens TaxID=6454 RepID=UPI00201F369C|nr:parapinopsin-like [Haliotis rufescens]XP_048248648.1 parapinopsin-like [Haliotis rufescens]